MSILVIFGITLAAFLLVIVGMAVGVLMGRRAISGSCGGLANQTNERGETSCSLCSNPDAACRELSRRMAGNSEAALPDECSEANPECAGARACENENAGDRHPAATGR